MFAQRDTFEPDIVFNILNSLQPSNSAKDVFRKSWDEKVLNRVTIWKTAGSSKLEAQLIWEANIVAYVDFVYEKTKVHGNASALRVPPTLSKQIPLLGPTFVPPSYCHIMKRSALPKIVPETAYLVPLTVIHPFYFSGTISKCPKCGELKNITWDSWNGTGGREVQGLHRNERAIGYQLRCKTCHALPKAERSQGFCFATTNHIFWENWEHWKIPCGIPIFNKRSAVTRELYDLVIELRPSSTSAGLAEHIKQLHLLEWKRTELEYLSIFEASSHPGQLKQNQLFNFSSPDNPLGFNDAPITNDIITEIYLDFSKNFREAESVAYCKTRTAQSLSLDNTFKSASKAVVIDNNGKRTGFFTGGILSIINEYSETMGWRFCQTASPAETGEMLEGIRLRHENTNVPVPNIVIVDNCCQVRRAISQKMPGVEVVLDVLHFVRRYGAVILNGTRNPRRGKVLQDIRNAIISHPSKGAKSPAKYYSKDEQANRLQTAYSYWLKEGGVWSAAASKVHSDQMAHVAKGCLARSRQDIRTDGSRIEGSHKAWNSLQRAQPSGLEVYNALAHDHVHRRNIRIATSAIEGGIKGINSLDFLTSAHGSHHTQLVSYVASRFNFLRGKESSRVQQQLTIRVVLQKVVDDQKFGLVASDHSRTFGGLLTIKDEVTEEEELLAEIEERAEGPNDPSIIQQLCIDESLLNIPAEQAGSEGVSVKRKQQPSNNENELSQPPPPSKRARNEESSDSHVPMEVVIEKSSLPTESTAMNVDQPLPGVHQSLKEFFNTTQAAAPKSSSLAKPTAANTLKSAAPMKIEDLKQQVKAPIDPLLTRSQLLFSIATQIDPRLLSINNNLEFFLFMEMRQEFRWTSFGMTSQKWVSAVKIYNQRVLQRGKDESLAVTKKSPRALMDKLSEIETRIFERVSTDNFKSRQGGETFWRRHCFAVPELVNLKQDGGSGVKKTRKVQMCSRCQTVMYPGPNGCPENHRRGYCADGVRQIQKDKSTEALPPWPQPQGIFKVGKEFHVLQFLSEVRSLYEKVFAHQSNSSSDPDFTMEDLAFAAMLKLRTTVRNDRVCFQLFDLDVFGGSDSLIHLENDQQYLFVDCLHSVPT